eukprot:m.72633 g.72633  ORF g.72633 m.72633 type:complete len:725 (-) comp11747_c0_seq1:75-2249(-)
MLFRFCVLLVVCCVCVFVCEKVLAQQQTPNITVDNGNMIVEVGENNSIFFHYGKGEKVSIKDITDCPLCVQLAVSLSQVKESLDTNLTNTVELLEHRTATFIADNEVSLSVAYSSISEHDALLLSTASTDAVDELETSVSTSLTSLRSSLTQALGDLESTLGDDTASIETRVANVEDRVGAVESQLVGHCGRLCYPGERVSTPCTDSSAIECTACDDGTFSPGGLVDECKMCRQCDTLFEYKTADCTLSSDTQCAMCPSCEDGLTYSTGDCVDSEDHCKECTQCSHTQYQVKGCTLTSDTVCADCSTGTCDTGEYELHKCSPLHDRVCAPCTECPDGFAIEQECTVFEDTKCKEVDFAGYGGDWLLFWWFKGIGSWPSGESDVLKYPYGSCDKKKDSYCFGRLPSDIDEFQVEILAMDKFDGSGNVYKWRFDPGNPTAHAMFRAMRDHVETPFAAVKHNVNFHPTVLNGGASSIVSDSFQYRDHNGIKSLALDDDNCYCHTTLEMGRQMCGSGGESNIGVELYDNQCTLSASTNNHLYIFFRKAATPLYGGGWKPFWWHQRSTAMQASDMLGEAYGGCDLADVSCYGRIDSNADESSTELLLIDGIGTVTKLAFDPNHNVAHSVWESLTNHKLQRIVQGSQWNYDVLRGSRDTVAIDSWMYRNANGILSILLDDDNCYCHTLIEAGNRMCGSNSESIRGVDNVYDPGCNYVSEGKSLSMFFRKA